MGTFYDREIEYLESTGTQYIDTGIESLKENSKIEIVFSYDDLNGRQLHGGGNYLYFGVNEERWETAYSSYVSGADTSKHTFTKSVAVVDSNYNIKCFIDGTSQYDRTFDSVVDGGIFLFALNSNQTAVLPSSGKLYSAKIWKNDILVFDAIPVRVGQTGYLFDRVTCQLFGNAGTGSFVLGDDMYDARVEYLQSSGTQYIDTGIIYNSSLIVEMGAKLTSSANGNLMGLYYRNSSIYRWYLRTNTSNQIYTYFGTITNKYGSIALNTWYRMRMNYQTLYYNDSSVASGASTFNTDTHEVAVYIFAMHDVDVTTSKDEASNFRAYQLSYFKIYDNSVLVRDLIPVRKGQVGYLYDRVSNQLFANRGSGSFTFGSDIPDIPSDYDAEVEYITFDGSQSIDTGLYGDLNTDVEVTCLRTSSGNENIFGSRLYDGGREVTLFASGKNLYLDFYDGTTSRLIQNDYYNSWVTLRSNKNLRQINAINKTLHVTNTTQFSTEFTTPNTMRIGGFEGVFSLPYKNFIGYMGAVQIRQNGTLVRDYIPVRKNGVGYLYDKITQKMFGNEFSSSFGVGHDVVWPAPVPATVGTCRYYSRREAMIEEARPYDAEVEYIASNAESGFEIVTNNAIPARSTFELKYWITNLLDIYKYQVFFSRYTNVSRTPTTRMGPRSQSYYYQGYDNSGNARYLLRSSARVGNLHTLKVDYTNKKITVDETEYNFDFTSFNASSDSSRICLFKGINSDYVGLVGRIYSFKATYNGQVVLDLIPVRKGTEGRMYDKVTGAVYKNTSTGTFVVGPDVV